MTRAQAIPDTITVHVPFSHVKRGGRKEMVLPPQTTVRAKIDGTLVKALARAFRIRPVSARFQVFSACQFQGMSSSMRLIL